MSNKDLLDDPQFEGLLEDHILEIGKLLRKNGRTADDVQRLIELFHWYCNHSSQAFRNMPINLAKYVAEEVKRYSDDRRYRPFPARTGRPGVINWDAVDEQVESLLEFRNLDEPDAKINLTKLFNMVIRDLNAESENPLDTDTLDKHIQSFRKARAP